MRISTPSFVRIRNRALVLALVALSLYVSTAQAQENASRWTELRTAFESGARHGTVWNIGWRAVYGGSLAHNVYTLHDSSDSDERFDAKVGAIKSGLALADTFLNPQPHAEALERFERLAAQGDTEALEEAERLRVEIANAEQHYHHLNTRFRPLVVNLVGGLAIALGDDRPGDGAINFATGMLVNEISLWTQPSSVSQLGSPPEGKASLRLGKTNVELRYSWLFSPDQVAIHVRF